MSFINMLANDVWSDQDISRRVQGMIRSKFTQEDELKAARLARTEPKTESEVAFIREVDATIAAALQEGRSAERDMELLRKALNIEECQRIVAIPIPEQVFDDGNQVINQTQIDNHLIVTKNCQAVIDSASKEVLALIALRNPT